MAMSVGEGGGEDDPMVEMNTTPLIDVLLVLLIMLIITIPLQTHNVSLDMPQMDAPPSDTLDQPQVVDLEVDFDGTVFLDGEPVRTLAELEERFQTMARTRPQPEVHLRPNRLVEYDYVAKVLSTAQRNGLKKIGFVGNEQYM